MYGVFDETKPQYIEMEAYGVGLRAALLQTRSDTSYPRGEALDDSILRPIHKQEPVKHGKIPQYRKRSTRYTVWPQEIPS